MMESFILSLLKQLSTSLFKQLYDGKSYSLSEAFIKKITIKFIPWLNNSMKLVRNIIV